MLLQLPPLSAVRAFEAAARHASFTRAAEELGMTQAAVSYQIKVLEERVGVPLFLRRPRQVVLTEAGRRLAPAVSEAFALLSEAYAAVRTGAQGTLVISTIQTFGSNWLARHLGSFQIAHPSIAVRLDTSSHMVDFAREDIDVGIRSGGGKWPGLAVHMLFPADFTPMLSPKLADSIGGVSEPADLLRLPILDPTDRWWTQWFAAAGVQADELAKRPGNSMGSQAFEASAAMAGQGVAILTRALFAAELADGRLIQPFDLVGDDGHAYWLVYPEARRNVPKVQAFREWLLAEIAASLTPQATAAGSLKLRHFDAGFPPRRHTP
jgi:LysR family transcriptional regulator, glycine cleavage system transcriptional activator